MVRVTKISEVIRLLIYFFLFLFVGAACSVTSRTKEEEALSGGVVV